MKSFLQPFLAVFFVGLFFLQLQFLFRHLEELVGKGVEFWLISKMMAYVSVALLPFNFPLAILLASLITFGTLGENYELIAMKAAGISLFQIIKPLLIVVSFLCIAAFFIANNLIPETNVRYMKILNGLQEQRPELALKDGIFSNEINGYSIKAEKIDKSNNTLYDIIIYEHLDNKNNSCVTVAPSGRLWVTPDKRYVIIELNDGYCYQEGSELFRNTKKLEEKHYKTSFSKQTFRIRIHDFDFTEADEAVFANHHRMLTIAQLNQVIDSLKTDFSNHLHANFGTLVPYSKRTTPRQLLAPDTNTGITKHQVLQAQNTVRNNIQVILKHKNTLYQKHQTIRQYKIEKHRKITLSLAIFLFFIIGSSFGTVVRKGGISIPAIFCFLLLIVYFVVGLLGERLILSGVLSVFEGAWLPHCALLPLAVWLAYLAINDSSILVSDSYHKMLARIFGKYQNDKVKD